MRHTLFLRNIEIENQNEVSMLLACGNNLNGQVI